MSNFLTENDLQMLNSIKDKLSEKAQNILKVLLQFNDSTDILKNLNQIDKTSINSMLKGKKDH